MKNISIKDCNISLIKLPIGQITYRIDWKEKPHRNVFRRNVIETISINIRKEVLLAETLITQKLWKTIMQTNPSSFMGDNRPVETVSFNEISSFIERLQKTTSVFFRLPTESEYLYACAINYNNDVKKEIDDYIWYEKNSQNKTQPVGIKKTGHLLCSDLLGNLYHFLTADIIKVKDEDCIYRGASWSTQQLWVDQDYVFKTSKNYKNNTIGFRLAVDM